MLYCVLLYDLNITYALTCKFTTEFTHAKLLVIVENYVLFSVQKFIFVPVVGLLTS